MSGTEPSVGVTPPRRLARIVLAVGVCLGAVYLVYKAGVMPEKAATDFDVYRAAATEMWTGDFQYGRSSVGVDGLSYRYPPIFMLWFAFYPLVPPFVGLVIHVAVILAASVVLGLTIASEIERRGVGLERVDQVLIVSFVALCPFGAPSLFFVNVNHVVALAMGVGLIWLARGREWRSAASLGAAALVKVFPTGIGVWLLYRRAWRAVAAATATGVGGLVAGVAIFGPELTRSFFLERLLPRAAPGTDGTIPASSIYVSLRRPLSIPFADIGAAGLTVLAVAILAPIVGYCYWQAEDPSEQLLALFATLAAILLVLPAYSNYYVILLYPLVPLLYLLNGRERLVFATGACMSLLTLKLEGALTLVAVLPVGPELEATLSAAARTLYTVATPVLVGTVVMLAACVIGVRQHDSTATTTS